MSVALIEAAVERYLEIYASAWIQSSRSVLNSNPCTTTGMGVAIKTPWSAKVI